MVPLPSRLASVSYVAVMSYFSCFASFSPPADVSMFLSDKENLKRSSSLKIWAHSGNFKALAAQGLDEKQSS